MRATLFRRLEIFRTVIDTGTAKAAADRLGISQPAVSQHLAQAEQELGLILFARERGRLIPTEAGLALYDELEFAFNGLERIENFAADVRSYDRGVLRIALPHSFCHAIMPKALAAFSRQHPQMRYEIALANYAGIVAMVASRSVDLGVAKEPIGDVAIATEPIARCDTVCVLSRQHRLAKRKRLTIDDIADEPLIMIGRQRPWRSEIDVLYRHASRVPKIRLETRSVGSACSFAAEGMGIAIVPELLARQYVSRAICMVPLDVPISHSFVVAYPATLRSRSLAVDFAGIIASMITGKSLHADIPQGQKD